MKCDFDVLSHYLDGMLTLPGRIDLEKHLQRCGPCRAELETLRGVDRTVGRWGARRVGVPAATDARIVRSVGRKRVASLLSLGKLTPAAFGTTAAALLVLVSVNLGSIVPASPQTAAVGYVASTKIVKQSAALIRARRISAIIGGYPVQRSAVVTVHRIRLPVS